MAAETKPSRIDRLDRRIEGSRAEQFAKRLMAMDVINRAMLFAAILFVCFFPFVIVLAALSGRSAVATFVALWELMAISSLLLVVHFLVAWHGVGERDQAGTSFMPKETASA